MIKKKVHVQIKEITRNFIKEFFLKKKETKLYLIFFLNFIFNKT